MALARRRSSSPSASRRSRAYSRIVASIAKRGSPLAPSCRRDEALVAQRAEPVERRQPRPRRRPGTRPRPRRARAADEHAEPPEQRLLRGRRAGRSSRRSCRAASAGAPAGRARRRSGACRPRRGGRSIASGVRTFARAAASSIASGRPSRRAQISATAAAFSSVSAKSGRRPAPARRTARPRRWQQARGGDAAVRRGQRERRDGELVLAGDPQRLAARRPAPSPAAAARRSSATDAAAARTCSKLSSTSSSCLSRRWSREGSRRRDSPGATCTSRTSAIALGTRSGSDSGARSTKYTPPAKSSRCSDATSIASRVLPVPPGPISVTTRTS